MTLDEASEWFSTACKFCVNVKKWTEIMCWKLMRNNSLLTTCGKDTHLPLSDCVTVSWTVSKKYTFLCQITQFNKLLETGFNCILHLCSQWTWCVLHDTTYQTAFSEGLSSSIDAILQQNNLVCDRLPYPYWFFQAPLQDPDANRTNNHLHLNVGCLSKGQKTHFLELKSSPRKFLPHGKRLKL